MYIDFFFRWGKLTLFQRSTPQIVCDSFSIFLQKINIVEHVEEGLKAGEYRHFYKCYVRQKNIHSVLESFLKS